MIYWFHFSCVGNLHYFALLFREVSKINERLTRIEATNNNIAVASSTIEPEATVMRFPLFESGDELEAHQNRDVDMVTIKLIIFHTDLIFNYVW